MTRRRSRSVGVTRGLVVATVGAGVGGAAGWFFGLGPIGPGSSAAILSLVGAVVGYSIAGPPGGSIAAMIVVTCGIALGGLGVALGRILPTDETTLVYQPIGAVSGFIVGGILGTILVAAWRSRAGGSPTEGVDEGRSLEG